MERNNDIKNYLRGIRNGVSANRLEREALSDPFLYEALEGLTSIPGDPIDGLIRLERQLNERGRGTRMKNKSWWYIAASFLVLAMCGTLWFAWEKDGASALKQEVAVADARKIRSEDDKTILSMSGVPAARTRIADSPVVADSVRVDTSREMQVKQAKTRGLLPDDTGRRGTSRLRMKEIVPVNTEKSAVTGEKVEVESMTSAGATVRGVADTVVSAADIDRFNRHVAVALKYPEVDVERGNEGVILVSFELNKRNMPSRIRIKGGFSKESNKELIRLLLESPKWETSHSGERIYASVRFTIGKNGAKHSAVLVREKSWE